MTGQPLERSDDARFFAPCPRGLEGLLVDELGTLAACEIMPTAGGVGFSGPLTLCYRANLESRIASRVLWQVTVGEYADEQDLYEQARRCSWPDWFSHRCTIKVKVSAQHCSLKSLEFVTLRIKDAVCDAFRATTGQRPTVETQRPDVLIVVFLDERSSTFYLDTSGEPLFKRGTRSLGGAAPLRENLAAGILRLAGWPGATTLLDPMCGSGTILIEAAQMAAGVPPGLSRRFAFERFSWFDGPAWQAMRANRRADPSAAGLAVQIYGSDIDGTALAAARANLTAAGLERSVQLRQQDVLSLSPPADEGLLVTNPPYGVRVGTDAHLAALYPRFGDVLKQRFSGWRACLLTADLRLPKLIGLAPSRRIPLFNGPLECRLYEFELVKGSMRGRSRTKPGATGQSDGSRPVAT